MKLQDLKNSKNIDKEEDGFNNERKDAIENEHERAIQKELNADHRKAKVGLIKATNESVDPSLFSEAFLGKLRNAMDDRRITAINKKISMLQAEKVKILAKKDKLNKTSSNTANISDNNINENNDIDIKDIITLSEAIDIYDEILDLSDDEFSILSESLSYDNIKLLNEILIEDFDDDGPDSEYNEYNKTKHSFKNKADIFTKIKKLKEKHKEEIAKRKEAQEFFSHNQEYNDNIAKNKVIKEEITDKDICNEFLSLDDTDKEELLESISLNDYESFKDFLNEDIRIEPNKAINTPFLLPAFSTIFGESTLSQIKNAKAVLDNSSSAYKDKNRAEGIIEKHEVGKALAREISNKKEAHADYPTTEANDIKSNGRQIANKHNPLYLHGHRVLFKKNVLSNDDKQIIDKSSKSFSKQADELIKNPHPKEKDHRHILQNRKEVLALRAKASEDKDKHIHSDLDYNYPKGYKRA